MDGQLPHWLSTEDRVKTFFELSGFQVENVSVEGRQIDAVATKHDALDIDPERYVIEITTEKVGVDKGSKDFQKLLLASKKHSARMLLISTVGFTDDQKATLKQLNVIPLTYDEFEGRLINLRRYALNALEDLRTRPRSDIGYDPSSFIEPTLVITDPSAREIPATKWIDDVLNDPKACICALLGNLGSGKTSLLQRILEIGCQRFIEAKGIAPVPLYLPLGRYKQHSGDIEQMLMAELRRIGQTTYPTALVRFFLDSRRIVLLLDGLDEVHPIQNSGDVLETVTSIITSVGKSSSAVLTCRRQFMETTQEELAYFGAYTSSHLAALQVGLARTLREHPTTYIANLQPFDAERVYQYLSKRCSMSRAAVDDLFTTYYGFKDLASTPVLLAMIATTVEENLIDPTKQDGFPLADLYEAYANRWLERDFGRAKLNHGQRAALSESLADHMVWESKDSADWAYLRAILREHPEWRNSPLTDEQAELDVRNSGFLVRELDNRYRFIHRSLMEFFAAKAELHRLWEGARPRHFPTDGFRLFFSILMAKKWMLEGAVPFPSASWSRSRGDYVIGIQMSYLATATESIPAGSMARFENVAESLSATAMTWKRTEFRGLKWKHSGGDLALEDCVFYQTAITIGDGSRLLVENCTFENSTIAFAVTPKWDDMQTGFGGRIDAPCSVWRLAELVDAGAVVKVGDTHWRIGMRHLELLAEVNARVKGKIRKRNLFRGSKSAELKELLPVLKKYGLVDEDSSRKEHQLKLTSTARDLIGKLQNDPMSAQAELARIFDPNPL